MFRLLIVSPSQLYADTIALTLASPQIEVRHLDESQCVIEVCRNTHFELIIFLSIAPYFTSMNIVEYLRGELEEMPSIYVIAHSHAQATILSLLECGVNQYMTFPINLYRLRDKVYNLLQK